MSIAKGFNHLFNYATGVSITQDQADILNDCSNLKPNESRISSVSNCSDVKIINKEIEQYNSCLMEGYYNKKVDAFNIWKEQSDTINSRIEDRQKALGEKYKTGCLADNPNDNFVSVKGVTYTCSSGWPYKRYSTEPDPGVSTNNIAIKCCSKKGDNKSSTCLDGLQISSTQDPAFTRKSVAYATNYDSL